MPALLTQVPMVLRSSSLKRNRLPHRIGGAEVENLAGLGSSAGEVEQPVDDGQQRVGLRERTVGEPHLQPVPGMPRTLAGLGDGAAEPERRLDERRVRLDVGAHHQHVARLERRVVGEQAEDDLAQHLDLPRRPVAGMHLHAAIGRVENPFAVGRELVGREVVLEPAEQVGRALDTHPVEPRVDGRVDVDERGERALELTDVAAQRREQRVPDALVRGVVTTWHWRR